MTRSDQCRRDRCATRRSTRAATHVSATATAISGARAGCTCTADPDEVPCPSCWQAMYGDFIEEP